MIMQRLGPPLIVLGLVFLFIGVLAWKGWLSWMGRLPGDLRFESHGIRLFVPFTSMLIVSLLLTIVVNVLRRFFG